jgi:hypothetical protein
MMRLPAVLFLLTFTLALNSCLLRPDNDVDTDPWENAFNKPFNSDVRALHVTGNELLVLTDLDINRYNSSRVLQERINLPLPARLFGRPVLSDKVLARHAMDNNNSQFVQFIPTKGNGKTKQYPLNNAMSSSAEFFEYEDFAFNSGAFHPLGSFYLFPLITRPVRKNILLLLQVDLNTSGTQVDTVKLLKRIEIPGSQGDFNAIYNVRFAANGWWITTLYGTFTVDTKGTIKKAFADVWYDVFPYEGKLYGSAAFTQNDLYESSDNGASWITSPFRNPGLGVIEYTGKEILSQTKVGEVYALPASGSFFLF